MPISLVRGDAEVLRGVTAFLRQLADLPDAAIADFAAAAKMRVLEPGASFCDQGQTVHELGYVQSGIVRYFVTLPDGNEATKDFSFAGGFTLSFGSAVMQRPAQVAIAAVVRTTLWVWPYRELLDRYESDSRWGRVGRRIAELLYVRKEQRELSFLLLDAQARYAQLHAQFGAQVNAIPQYFLASYLGIRPQSLSRLRKRIVNSPR